MAFHFSPKIVTDGLVFALDAANHKSYPGSGTAWDDISGYKNNATISNATFNSDNGGYFEFFPPDSAYVYTSTTPTVLQGDPNFTVCGWFKRTAVIAGASPWGLGGGTNLQGINAYNYNGSNDIALDLWGTSTYSTGLDYSLDWQFLAWCKTAGSFTTSNVSIYVDLVEYTGGDLTVLRGGSGTPNINSSGIFLGRAGSVNGYYAGIDISHFMIYNRILSLPELTQNYNTLKSRFGL